MLERIALLIYPLCATKCLAADEILHGLQGSQDFQMAAQEALSATQVRSCLHTALPHAFRPTPSMRPTEDLLSRTNIPDSHCAGNCAGCCNLGQTVFNGACQDFVSSQPDQLFLCPTSITFRPEQRL